MGHAEGVSRGRLGRRAFLKGSGATLLAMSTSSHPTSRASAEEPKAEPQAKPAGGRERLPTGFLYDPVYKQHDTGPHHPESPARLDAILKGLRQDGLDKKLQEIKARAATDEDLTRVHTKEYVALVRKEIAAGEDTLTTGDTNVCRKSLEAALLAAGGVMQAVDDVLTGKVRNAFCAVRPPGHHAGPARGMGFCVFNNIALAARYAQRQHKIGKALIVDWDVHHGNGTQDTFYEDGSVFFFSTHQFPWYPGTGWAEETGKGKGRGCILNCPFPAGAGRNLILGAFREKLLPAAKAFKPELILISAGFDSRRGDPLGQFQLTDDDFVEMTKLVLGLAAEFAQNRVVSVLEGGYSLEGLAAAVTAHVRTLGTA
jgi:acetoin utilization deacetylase AcuC-like enzyme